MRPKSKDLKIIQGTFEPSRESQGEPVTFKAAEKLYAPSEWPDQAKSIFRDLCGLMREAGYLTKGVYIGLRMLAINEHLRREAEAELLKPKSAAKHLKAFEIHSKAVERLCTKHGLFPADLYRVPGVKPAEEEGSIYLK